MRMVRIFASLSLSHVSTIGLTTIPLLARSRGCSIACCASLFSRFEVDTFNRYGSTNSQYRNSCPLSTRGAPIGAKERLKGEMLFVPPRKVVPLFESLFLPPPEGVG